MESDTSTISSSKLKRPRLVPSRRLPGENTSESSDDDSRKPAVKRKLELSDLSLPEVPGALKNAESADQTSKFYFVF